MSFQHDKKLREVHDLYCLAYEKCALARHKFREFVGFQRRSDGFRLIVSRDDYGGKSSARMGLTVIDWASNVLYRLQEEGFIDLPLDEYFEQLSEVEQKDQGHEN